MSSSNVCLQPSEGLALNPISLDLHLDDVIPGASSTLTEMSLHMTILTIIVTLAALGGARPGNAPGAGGGGEALLGAPNAGGACQKPDAEGLRSARSGGDPRGASQEASRCVTWPHVGTGRRDREPC